MPARLRTPRHHEVLMAVIRTYLESAEPVGSRTVVERHGLGVSPATVRAVLVELEADGHLLQPHPSSGRIPTEKAYRHYVDTVKEDPALGPDAGESIRVALAGSRGVEELLRRTSRLVSDLSGCVGFVLPPRRRSSAFRSVTLVRIRPRLVLVVLVSVSGGTSTRLVPVFEDHTQESLDRMARYLNDRFQGCGLEEMRRLAEEDLRQGLENLDRFMRSALQLGRLLLSDTEVPDIIVDGASHILDSPESFADLDWVRRVLRAFEEKSGLVALLERAMTAGEVTTFIGTESGLDEMRGASLVASGYEDGVAPLGALGVVGPQRMEYRRVIPLVRAAATVVTEHLCRNQP